jgi:hypothetical protein
MSRHVVNNRRRSPGPCLVILAPLRAAVCGRLLEQATPGREHRPLPAPVARILEELDVMIQNSHRRSALGRVRIWPANDSLSGGACDDVRDKRSTRAIGAPGSTAAVNPMRVPGSGRRSPTIGERQ